MNVPRRSGGVFEGVGIGVTPDRMVLGFADAIETDCVLEEL